jgi:hypothetical protein
VSRVGLSVVNNVAARFIEIPISLKARGIGWNLEMHIGCNVISAIGGPNSYLVNASRKAFCVSRASPDIQPVSVVSGKCLVGARRVGGNLLAVEVKD